MSRPSKQPRLLIFVIAYYAESTLTLGAASASRPRSSTTYDCEVLVVDDASEDRTFEIGPRVPAGATRTSG